MRRSPRERSRSPRCPRGATYPNCSSSTGAIGPVLLIDGEELVGAKQNRVLNLTILAAPHSELVIPVSCVEQGRWHEVSAAFCASPRVHFAAGRAAKVASVSDCLAEGQGAVSDQSEVWHHIAAKAARITT